MNEQLTVTEESAKLRKDAKETSRLAALKALPNSGTARFDILRFIVMAGNNGRTDEDISIGLILEENSVRPRRVELVEGGFVRDSGQKRLNRFRNQMIVWVATDKAYELVP